MDGFLFPGRCGGGLDELVLDVLLDGQPLPPDVPEQAYLVAEMLACLAGPAVPGELAGQAAARAAYARAAAWAGRGAAAGVRARLAAGAAAAVLGLGGAAAAFAGALPGPVQDLAHQMIGAPPAGRAPAGRAAAYLLCGEYERALAQGPASASADASQKLAMAAGGASKIGAWCAAAGRAGWAGVSRQGDRAGRAGWAGVSRQGDAPRRAERHPAGRPLATREAESPAHRDRQALDGVVSGGGGDQPNASTEHYPACCLS